MSVQEPQCIPLMALPQDEKPLPSLPSRNRRGAMGSLKRLFLKSPSRNRRSMTATWFTLLFFVLHINVVLTVVLYVKSVEPEGVSRLYRILSTNNCKAMEQQISFYHLGINILSTVVLAASGYFTQLLSSPTREELDKLHARRQWQHIGIRSVFNIPIGTWQRVSFGILTFTALPFHLLSVQTQSAHLPMLTQSLL